MRAVVAAVAAADANNLPLNQSLLGPLDSRGLFLRLASLTALLSEGSAIPFLGVPFLGV